MKNTIFRIFHSRLYLCRLYSRLSSANLSCFSGNNDDFIEKMKTFYAELLSFRETYATNDYIKSIYPTYSELLLEIKNAIANNAVHELYHLSKRIRVFLDKLYDAAFVKNKLAYSRSIYMRASILAAVFIVLIAASWSPLKKRYSNEKEHYDLIANEELFKQKTKQDIFALEEALNKYYLDNRSYPKSSGGWDAIIAIYGQSREDWIPGLAPKYIKELPVDPRKVKDPVKQYMYKSDGTDYKLIAHFPVGMSDIIKEYGQFADPRRPSWAFGVWTERAKNW